MLEVERRSVAVIDTQTHWYSRTLWDAYTQLDLYPQCRADGDGYKLELAPGSWFDIPPVFYDLDVQFSVFDAVGIETIISSSASFGDVDMLPPSRAADLARQLNQERAAAQRKYAGRFYGLATLPWQAPVLALDVLDDAAALGLVGVLLHSNIAGQAVDCEERRPLYRRIAELGLALVLHPARTIMEPSLRDYGLEYLVGFPFDTSLAALRLVLSGIVAENLDLRIVHPHCGATLPYLAGRIDSSHDQAYSMGAALPIPPSKQLQSFFTDTVCQSEQTLAFARGFYGDENIMFGSDFPFFSPESELTFARRAMGRSEHVLHDNARRVFGLDGHAEGR
jgi:aminocarboxymuconate-semialdehyde decarboxylase